MINAQEIRKKICIQRQQLHSSEIEKKSKLIAQTFDQLNLLSSNLNIAAYCAVKGEVDPRFILDKAWVLGKKCYLPILNTSPANTLQFVHFEKGEPCILNRYSIPEPSLKKKIILPNELDMVLVPLVAFDEEGNRLGMGGGFYDRTFNFLKNNSVKKPFLVGLAYEFQKIDLLSPNVWDVGMHAIVTEKQAYFKFR